MFLGTLLRVLSSSPKCLSAVSWSLVLKPGGGRRRADLSRGKGSRRAISVQKCPCCLWMTSFHSNGTMRTQSLPEELPLQHRTWHCPLLRSSSAKSPPPRKRWDTEPRCTGGVRECRGTCHARHGDQWKTSGPASPAHCVRIPDSRHPAAPSPCPRGALTAHSNFSVIPALTLPVCPAH